MAFNIYTPARIAKVIEHMPPATTFLRRTFFKNTVTYGTKNVNFDIVEGDRKVAPYVNPKRGGKVIPNKGYRTETYTAPLVAPEKITEADEMLDRMPGEQLTSDMTPAERAIRKIKADLIELEETITRREEVQCSEALFTGKITIKGYGVDDEVDFGFTNKETLTSGKKWTASGSDPIGDLRRWKRAIHKEGHVNADICIMSESAAAAFINNEAVQKLLDIKNYSIAKINPMQIDTGVTYIGTISALGMSIYTYDEYYTDDWTEEGKETLKPYVPDGVVGLFSSKAQYSMIYGAISDFNPKTQDPQTHRGRRYGESYLSDNNKVRTLVLSSRPLAIPHNIKSWFVATVV